MNLRYIEKENKARYGIMYSEEATRTSDTVWYETAEARLDGMLEIERTGKLTINYNGSPLGKTVMIRSYVEVEADKVYYIINSNKQPQ